jgi:hypothetical protein
MRDRVLVVLALSGWVLVPAAAAPAAPAGRDAAPAAMAVTPRPAAELESRRRELDARSRNAVLAEVQRRAAELGVTAPADRLTDLLFTAAWLELERDGCGAAPDAARRCAAATGLLAETERGFRELTGISIERFRSGRAPQAGGSPAPGRAATGGPVVAPLFVPGGGSSRTDPQHCVCGVTIASFDRWMNRWWGLECGGHSGHGVCSNDLDWEYCPWPISCHSPGAGAMTGKIRAFFGETMRVQSCPDNHRTCFRGPQPSPDKPGGGEWTNVCNCDTLHSQFSSPLIDFYGGDETDPELVVQTGFSNLLSDGPCDDRFLSVAEEIVEHDPVCCDDPMGTLNAFAAVAHGTTVTDVPASVVNCNGGSQSGVPPFCGSFGATLRLTTSCQTLNDDGFASCYGRCGSLLADATCNCDFGCQQAGDCCFDYCDACAASGDGPAIECSFGGQ